MTRTDLLLKMMTQKKTIHIYPRKVYRWYHIEKREWDWIASSEGVGRTNIPLKDVISWLEENFPGRDVEVHKFPYDIFYAVKNWN